jgi:tRNA/rRNA methyltransferase
MSFSMTDQTNVFHSRSKALQNVHIILVRPENSQNVGSVARALANMGMGGDLIIVDENRTIIDDSCRRVAKHAGNRLDTAIFCSSLTEAIARFKSTLVVAATARIGSAHRPHPLKTGVAVEQATKQLLLGTIEHLVYVFGPESDGLTNEEIEICDWVATIPSSDEYRSLNLSQSVLIFAYETRMNLLDVEQTDQPAIGAEEECLAMKFLALAEQVGFILPGDPFKMGPRLRQIISGLTADSSAVRTLHGLLDQFARTLEERGVRYKGRYRHKVADLTTIER